MTIYGRFGDPVELLRYAVLDDILRLEKRNPQKTDRDALANNSYVIAKYIDGSKAEVLYHQAYLKADGGAREIGLVTATWPRPFTQDDFLRVVAGTRIEHNAPCYDGRKWLPAMIVSRTATRLHVCTDSPPGYSLTASDAKKNLRWPAEVKL